MGLVHDLGPGRFKLRYSGKIFPVGLRIIAGERGQQDADSIGFELIFFFQPVFEQNLHVPLPGFQLGVALAQLPVSRGQLGLAVLQVELADSGFAISIAGQNLTSEVKGVVTFYTMFHTHPVAPNVVWVCRTLSCELRGGRSLQKHLEKRFGCKLGGTSQDGKFTLLGAECLAACGNAPMIQLNDRYYENLTIEKLDKIIDEVAAKTQVAAAPHHAG